MLWQIPEAKQQYTEHLRAVQSDGPQIVTGRKEEIAVVIDIADFHRLRGDVADVKDVLLGDQTTTTTSPMSSTAIEAERKVDLRARGRFWGRLVTYLLDTNVLSETRKREPAPSVANWIAATPPARLHVSMLTLGEIQPGIERVRGQG